MAASSWNYPEVDVFTAGEAIHITGRAAVLIDRIARTAERINGIAIGRVVGHIANRKVHLELRESGEVVRLAE
jgi:hypothetical protein